MAVIRRIGARATGDVHLSPGAILDDHRLTPPLLQLISERADKNVAGPTGAVGGDDPHGFARIGLGPGECRAEDSCSERDEQEGWRFHHALSLVPFSQRVIKRCRRRPYSTFIPARLTTSAHLAISAFTNGSMCSRAMRDGSPAVS